MSFVSLVNKLVKASYNQNSIRLDYCFTLAFFLAFSFLSSSLMLFTIESEIQVRTAGSLYNKLKLIKLKSR